MNMARNLIIRRYDVGIHYFYIYAKQRSKIKCGTINYCYLLNKNDASVGCNFITSTKHQLKQISLLK